VSGTTVTLVAVGTCSIQATQAGNANYAAATPVSQSFQVTQANQTITFGTLSSQVFGAAPFTVGATASSGLVVAFASTTPAICTVSGTTVTLVAVGTCTIQATQAGNTNYAAATPVSQGFQVTQASQTIGFGTLSSQVFGAAPFTVGATASSGLVVGFASTTPAVCMVSGTTVTLVAVGTCSIQATQAGNANYAAANPVSQSFQVTQANQTITFGTLSSQVFGAAPFTVGATASSGLVVAFASTTPAICTVSGTTVTLVAAGTCSIQATQAGNANYAAATPVSRSFQVTQASQTIGFGTLSSQVFGAVPFTVGATASSGLTVGFASTTPAVCTVSGTTVTLVAVGTCSIQATQAGNANYAAATPVSQSFQVTQASQTITFGTLSSQVFGAAPFTVGATASSGLTVGFASTTPTICTVSGTTVTLAAVGTCSIQATQAGNTNYAAATPVSQGFQVTQASQTITFGTLSSQVFGAVPFTVGATASSGLTVGFASTTPAICTVSGTTVTLVAVGTCTIQATQAGNTNYAAANPVSQSFQVTQASQTISFGTLSSQVFGAAPFTVGATASSGLVVGFASTTPAICTVSGTTVALVAVGTCTIQATQAGNANYAAAAPANQSFQVTQAPVTPAAIFASTGSGQGATVGTAFAGPLQALVKDAAGNVAPNAPVTFTGPSNGAGGMLANGSATYMTTTNSSGVATSATVTANTIPGSYSVTATATGVTTAASFSLTNLKAPALSITESHAGGFTQGQSGATYAITVGNAVGAGPSSGAVTVTEIVPAGLTLVSMSGGVTWNCTVLPVCTTTTVLDAGSSYPAITVTVNVASNAAASVTNQAIVSGGSSATAADAIDPTAIMQVSACDVNRDGNIGVSDIQLIIDEALGVAPAVNSLIQAGVVDVADVQSVIQAALGLGCPGS